MQRFTQLILILVGAGIAMGMAIATLSNRRSEQARAQVEVNERKSLAKFFYDIRDMVRTADVVVERQTVAGDLQVLETTLLFCPYSWDASMQTIPLPARRVTVMGDRVAIDALRVDCPRGILEDGFPLPASESERATAHGISVTLFGHVSRPAEEGHPESITDDDLLVPWGAVHPGYRPDPESSSDFEQRVWQRLGRFCNDDSLCRYLDVKVVWFPPIVSRLRPGFVYRYSLGSDQQLLVRELEAPKEAAELLKRAAKSTTQPDIFDQ